MTKREIIKTLLNKEIPERVGLNESFWPYIIPISWGAQGMPEKEDFLKRFNFDFRGAGGFSAPAPRPDLVRESVEETDEWRVSRNAWGATMKHWKSKAGTPEHVDFMVNSPEVWNKEFREAFIALDVRNSFDVPKLKQTYADAMAHEEFVTYGGLFIFEDMRRILGDLVMLESLLAEPEWITDFCTVLTNKYIDAYEFLFREIGLPDGVHIYEDLGYTMAPFASPAVHRELVHPHHKRLFSLFKDYNLPVILHTCGEFRAHIPAIIESGADCIQAIEAKTGMDIVKMAEQYKDKLCFMGNIDVRALESGDRAKIKEECLYKLNGMKAQRAPYIYMSDHSITYDVKLADFEYMQELFWENCRY